MCFECVCVCACSMFLVCVCVVCCVYMLCVVCVCECSWVNVKRGKRKRGKNKQSLMLRKGMREEDTKINACKAWNPSGKALCTSYHQAKHRKYKYRCWWRTTLEKLSTFCLKHTLTSWIASRTKMLAKAIKWNAYCGSNSSKACVGCNTGQACSKEVRSTRLFQSHPWWALACRIRGKTRGLVYR